MQIHFVNQTDRLVGDIHRVLISDEEKQCVRDAYNIKETHKQLYIIFKKEFKYKSFCIYGDVKKCLYDIFDLIGK